MGNKTLVLENSFQTHYLQQDLLFYTNWVF